MFKQPKDPSIRVLYKRSFETYLQYESSLAF